jgi:hypothetical protein
MKKRHPIQLPAEVAHENAQDTDNFVMVWTHKHLYLN